MLVLFGTSCGLDLKMMLQKVFMITDGIINGGIMN